MHKIFYNLIILFISAHILVAGEPIIPKNFEILTYSEFDKLIKNIENSPELLQQITEMAHNKNPDAMEILAEIENNKSVYNDKKVDLNLYEQAFNHGSARSGYKIALAYYMGLNGLHRNITKAIEYYDRAAHAGSLEAIIMVANIYRNGEETPRDINKALEYYDLPGVATNAITNYNRAMIYYTGDGVPKDLAKAKKYFEISAKKNFLDSKELAEKISAN